MFVEEMLRVSSESAAIAAIWHFYMQIAKNTAAIVERIGAKLDHLIEWFEREQEARDRRE